MTNFFAPVKARGQFQLYAPQSRQAPTITLFKVTPPQPTHYMGMDWSTGYRPDRPFDNLYQSPLSPSLIRRNPPKKTAPNTYFLDHEYIAGLGVPLTDPCTIPDAIPDAIPEPAAFQVFFDWLVSLMKWLLALVLVFLEFILKGLQVVLSLVGSVTKAVFGFMAMVITKENVGIVSVSIVSQVVRQSISQDFSLTFHQAAVFVVWKVIPKPWGSVRTVVEDNTKPLYVIYYGVRRGIGGPA